MFKNINPLAGGLMVVIMMAGVNVIVFASEKTENDFLEVPTKEMATYLMGQDVVYAELVTDLEVSFTEEKQMNYALTNGAEALANDNPIKQFLKTSGNILIYTVQEEKTVTEVADRFGVSEETIKWANNLRGDKLRAEQELRIPPVTGILHRVEEGETPESIAYDYQADSTRIREMNLIVAPGLEIIIPYGEIKDNGARLSEYRQSSLSSYFIRPVAGFNWGEIHNNNAVDIANVCGVIIRASADGVVIEEKAGDWNGGYGNYVLIEHGNGTKTLYAHNSKNLVTLGDLVKQGESIAKMGNTGEVHGETGCHLHFEVHGAVNPWGAR